MNFGKIAIQTLVIGESMSSANGSHPTCSETSYSTLHPYESGGTPKKNSPLHNWPISTSSVANIQNYFCKNINSPMEDKCRKHCEAPLSVVVLRNFWMNMIGHNSPNSHHTAVFSHVTCNSSKDNIPNIVTKAATYFDFPHHKNLSTPLAHQCSVETTAHISVTNSTTSRKIIKSKESEKGPSTQQSTTAAALSKKDKNPKSPSSDSSRATVALAIGSLSSVTGAALVYLVRKCKQRSVQDVGQNHFDTIGPDAGIGNRNLDKDEEEQQHLNV